MALLWKNVGPHGDSVIADGPLLAARRSSPRVAFENSRITSFLPYCTAFMMGFNSSNVELA
jgi:hypothetical protein